jgi:hypothetical protein
MFVCWVAASLCQYSFSQSKLRIEKYEEATLFLKTQAQKLRRQDLFLNQNMEQKTKKKHSLPQNSKQKTKNGTLSSSKLRLKNQEELLFLLLHTKATNHFWSFTRD